MLERLWRTLMTCVGGGSLVLDGLLFRFACTPVLNHLLNVPFPVNERYRGDETDTIIINIDIILGGDLVVITTAGTPTIWIVCKSIGSMTQRPRLMIIIMDFSTGDPFTFAALFFLHSHGEATITLWPSIKWVSGKTRSNSGSKSWTKI